MNPVEPPANDARWNDELTEREGDWDRDVWLSYCRDIHGLDEEMLADKPTGWIVQRAIEADETHGNPYR